MAGVYVNGDSEITKPHTVLKQNGTTEKDDKELIVNSDDTNNDEHINTLKKVNININIHSSEKEEEVEEENSSDKDLSNDSGINGSHELNENTENEQLDTANITTEKTSTTNDDNELNKINSETPFVDTSSEKNIITSITDSNNESNTNEDTDKLVDEPTIEKSTNNDDDESSEEEDSEEESEEEDEEEDESETNLSEEGSVKSLDDLGLTESYVKITLDSAAKSDEDKDDSTGSTSEDVAESTDTVDEHTDESSAEIIEVEDNETQEPDDEVKPEVLEESIITIENTSEVESTHDDVLQEETTTAIPVIDLDKSMEIVVVEDDDSNAATTTPSVPTIEISDNSTADDSPALEVPAIVEEVISEVVEVPVEATPTAEVTPVVAAPTVEVTPVVATLTPQPAVEETKSTEAPVVESMPVVNDTTKAAPKVIEIVDVDTSISSPNEIDLTSKPSETVDDSTFNPVGTLSESVPEVTAAPSVVEVKAEPTVTELPFMADTPVVEDKTESTVEVKANHSAVVETPTVLEVKAEPTEVKSEPVVVEVPASTTPVVENQSTVTTEEVKTEEDGKTEEDNGPKIGEELDILGNSLLKKKIILKGKGRTSRPLPGNIVTVRCEGRLASGTVVDKHEKLQFILSDEDVIQAFDLTVALMEDQEVATMYTDARYAYGVHGRPDYTPPIPPNSSLTYEIEILSIAEGPSMDTITNEDRIMYGDKKRMRGNDLYGKGEFSASINSYKRGIKYLEGTDDEDVMNMKIKCLNNLSAAQLKVKAYKMAVQSLDTVLLFEPDNVKALFRKGKCLEGLNKEKEALECIKNASMLDPHNKTITQELGRLRSRVAVTQEKERKIYQKMFSGKSKEEDGVKISKEEEDLNWSVNIASAVVGILGMVAGILWYKHR